MGLLLWSKRSWLRSRKSYYKSKFYDWNWNKIQLDHTLLDLWLTHTLAHSHTLAYSLESKRGNEKGSHLLGSAM